MMSRQFDFQYGVQAKIVKIDRTHHVFAILPDLVKTHSAASVNFCFAIFKNCFIELFFSSSGRLAAQISLPVKEFRSWSFTESPFS